MAKQKIMARKSIGKERKISYTEMVRWKGGCVYVAERKLFLST